VKFYVSALVGIIKVTVRNAWCNNKYIIIIIIIYFMMVERTAETSVEEKRLLFYVQSDKTH